MLDENLPTYRSQYSPDKPFSTVLYFTHNGSEPAPYYLLKRPTPSESRNQYALGLLDVQYASVIYGEVLVTPEWSQPTLSAAEVRANGGSPLAVPVTPSTFAIALYNPDQTIVVKYEKGSWSKDAWEFEMPERSFRLPSSSQIDAEEPQSQFAPKVMFRWKRDGRMSRDMTCYMTGRNLGNKKSKEPDITIALYKAAKNDGAVAMYEPNMNRVDVEDRKGLEVALLLSAEVIRDLYLTPKQNLFNTHGNAPPTAAPVSGAKPSRNPTPPAALSGASALGISMSGAINNETPQQSSSAKKPPTSSSAQAQAQARRDSDAMRQAKEAETKRLQAMVAEEKRMAREREKRDQEEQQRIKEMLEEEERERKKREAEEIERETERLRKEYGVPEPSASSPVGGRGPPSPALPPRPARGGWFGAPSTRPPPQPARPTSAAPPSTAQATSSQPNGKNGRTKLGGLFAPSPYSGPAGASSSAFFGSSAKSDDERDKKKKAKKKRSVHF
jgi:hypothetical protein